MLLRELGSSASRDISKSPKVVKASVLGMGVADIVRKCGHGPFSRSRRRWETPKRCCSSMTTRPRFEKFKLLFSRACVPTKSSADLKLIFLEPVASPILYFVPRKLFKVL